MSGGGGGGRGDELAYSGTTLLQGHLYCDGLANLVQVLGGVGGGGGGGVVGGGNGIVLWCS